MKKDTNTEGEIDFTKIDHAIQAEILRKDERLFDFYQNGIEHCNNRAINVILISFWCICLASYWMGNDTPPNDTLLILPVIICSILLGVLWLLIVNPRSVYAEAYPLSKLDKDWKAFLEHRSDGDFLKKQTNAFVAHYIAMIALANKHNKEVANKKARLLKCSYAVILLAILYSCGLVAFLTINTA